VQTQHTLSLQAHLMPIQVSSLAYRYGLANAESILRFGMTNWFLYYFEQWKYFLWNNSESSYTYGNTLQ